MKNEMRKREILEETDTGILSELIYNFVYDNMNTPDQEIINICRYYIIENPTPEISATCLKVILRMWMKFDEQIIDSFNYFLQDKMFWEFFDESLIICNFLYSLDGEKYRSRFEARTQKFMSRGKAEGLIQ
jgi:hypothetical protein